MRGEGEGEGAGEGEGEGEGVGVGEGERKVRGMMLGVRICMPRLQAPAMSPRAWPRGPCVQHVHMQHART